MIQSRLGLLHHERFFDQHISDDISAVEQLKTVKCILDSQECPSLGPLMGSVSGSVGLQLVVARGQVLEDPRSI